MGRLGKIFGPSWIPKTPPRWAKISQNRSQEPPQRHLEGVRCAKTAPTCLKIPPRWPKRPPRRAKRAPRGPKTPPGDRKYFQNGQGYLRYVAFLNPPEIPINWRGGTKAQPSQSAAALRNGVLDDGCKVLASIHPAIHLLTSNSPIFQALGNLTAYIPSP